MEVVNTKQHTNDSLPDNASDPANPEITENDERIFLDITRQNIAPEQRNQILNPPVTCPRQKTVMAVHWHPEFVPLDLISVRLHTLYPGCTRSLIIPTQHNVLMNYNGYAGAEVDCYSRGFNQKVQLLIHFKSENIEQAEVLKSMLAHTFGYRAFQLDDYIHTIIDPKEERIERAVRATGSDAGLINFVRIHTRKLFELLEKHESDIAPGAIKNRLIHDFFNALRPALGEHLINRAQMFLREIKQIVKSEFPSHYFFRTSEVIEEVRSLGGGIIIPHPEQFWPILLAEYDVDGYEVWNPQSRRYTEFLISVLNEKNIRRRHDQKGLLAFMGDDTHMSEKIKPPEMQDKTKASREIGFQPAWEDLSIRKKLISASLDKNQVITEYVRRLE